MALLLLSSAPPGVTPTLPLLPPSGPHPTGHINSWPIVAGLPRQRIRAVAAGDMHFAVLTHRDSLYMWGHNW